MKYSLFQIGHDTPEKQKAVSDAMVFGYNKKDFDHYLLVATIEANDLDEVFRIGNIGPEESITRSRPMHSVSVGDLIMDSDLRIFSVESVGFKEWTEDSLDGDLDES